MRPLSLANMGAEVLRYNSEDLNNLPPGEFDLVVVEGAVGRAPAAWLKALALGGRLAFGRA